MFEAIVTIESHEDGCFYVHREHRTLNAARKTGMSALVGAGQIVLGQGTWTQDGDAQWSGSEVVTIPMRHRPTGLRGTVTVGPVEKRAVTGAAVVRYGYGQPVPVIGPGSEARA